MFLWAVEPAEAAAAGAPWWLVTLLAALAVFGPILSGVLSYKAAIKSSQVTADAAKDTFTLESSRSDRDLILQALELCRSSDPTSQRQGEGLLEGLASMPGLSPDDAALVLSVTRPVIEPRLSEGRRAEELDGKLARFVRRFRSKGGSTQ